MPGIWAAAIMRMPGRLRITWQDEETLRIELDAGTQTRTLAFRQPRTESADWQGVSMASWDRSESAMARGGFLPAAAPRGGSLKVVTTRMKSGYLRRNGVPYSADALMRNYSIVSMSPTGKSLLVSPTEIVDPTYLATPFWTSTHFKQQTTRRGGIRSRVPLGDAGAVHAETDTTCFGACGSRPVVTVHGQAPPAERTAAGPAPGFDISGYGPPRFMKTRSNGEPGRSLATMAGFPSMKLPVCSRCPTMPPV
jgi:hypothetical protein